MPCTLMSIADIFVFLGLMLKTSLYDMIDFVLESSMSMEQIYVKEVVAII